MLSKTSLGTLLSHYWEVFRYAWKNRHFEYRELSEQYESEFLPDAIELQETNSAPILVWTAYLLIGMILLALLWASVGKVDIVAVASGRLVSNDYTKSIQSLGTSKIKEIMVQNGDRVKAGQLLIQLDDREAIATIAKLDALLPLLNKKMLAYKTLLANGYASEHDYFDKKKEYLEAISQLEQAQYAKETMSITSPIDGVVSSLNVHTVGGVVTPGQILLAVVPAQGNLMLEAYLNNKDIGFVRVGQEVAVKLEAFPFTRYGLIKGTVSSIAGDSIERQGEKPAKIKESDLEEKAQTTNNYQLRITLHQFSIDVAGEPVKFSSGMVATAEIKTGKRTLISYLLSPLTENLDEAARER